MTDAAEVIREEAGRLGFDHVRFASMCTPGPGIERFDAFLAEGRHAGMSWLVRGRDARAAPDRLLPGARSAVVLGVDYHHPVPPDPGGLTGRVARYAWGRDYHNLVGKRLRKLVRNLRARVDGFDGYWGVDARPLIERAWAAQSGLGYLGKNCCAILPHHGSYFFIAVVLVNIDLPPDLPVGDHCGRCRRCLDACPTHAFVGAGRLDAARCISYLTIEHRGSIPEPLRPKMGRWVFGCDDCQEVCPHNHHPPPSPHLDLAPRPGNAWLDLDAILRTPDDVLLTRFEGSPIRRAGPVGLKRNAAVVLGNLGDPTARPALEVALRHPSEVVRQHARWAIERC